MSGTTDLKKSLDSYRAKAGELRFVEVPELQYLMVDGEGDPNTSHAFTEAVETLYPVAYALKFHSKRVLERDYVVPPLEGLWTVPDGAETEKARWTWTLLLMVPDWLDEHAYAAALAAVAAKGRTPRLPDLRFASLAEGRCLQTLHLGPFDDEAPLIARMHDHIAQAGYALGGRHHEIYLSDLRRTAPERLRTILRQPVVG